MTTQTPDIIDNPIAKIVTDSGLSRGLADDLVQAFGPPFAQASTIIAESRRIVVTDATQVSEIKAARAARLKLREIRTGAEKRRKEMKEDSLRMGKAIDNVAKTITLLTEPEEARLEECEKFAERAEAARKAAIRAEREAALRPFNVDPSFYDLGSMPADVFANLQASLKLAYEARIAAEQKAEADRRAAEQARREEDERIRAENARLKAEREAAERAEAKRAADAEAKLQAERARADAERAAAEKARREAEDAARREREAAEAKARKEREAAEAERRRIQAEADAKLRAEREARGKLEREAREREQAEAKRKAAEAMAAKKAAAAPDADKLRALARDINAVKVPQMSTEEGEAALKNVLELVGRVVGRIREAAESLAS